MSFQELAIRAAPIFFFGGSWALWFLFTRRKMIVCHVISLIIVGSICGLILASQFDIGFGTGAVTVYNGILMAAIWLWLAFMIDLMFFSLAVDRERRSGIQRTRTKPNEGR